ncbi:hypothetical protein AB0D37_43545 [Streptomyces sp. NPDC048384]|uniref:hypothetical protein n=1 Tax=Streptomyces sp. NPDC048384 TaxID=3155487 RepID=UPI003447D154
MKLRGTLPIAIAAMAMAVSAPSASADGKQGGSSDCIISNHGNNNSSTNACRDVVAGTGHTTGTGNTVPAQAKLATQRIVSPPIRLLPGASTSLSLPCPAGTLLLGGGWQITPEAGTPNPLILESHPDTDDTRWLVVAQNVGTNPFSIQTVNQCTV